MESNFRKTAFKGILYNYLGKAISSVLSLFAFTYVARFLSIDDYGLYGIALNLIFLVTIILDFGIPEVILRYFPEYKEKKDLYILKELLKKCLLFMFLGCLSLIFLAVIFRFFLPNINKINYFNNLLPLFVLFGFLRVLTFIFGNILNAFFSQGFKNVSEIAYSLLKLILFYYAISFGYGVWGIIICWGIADFFLLIVYLVKFYKPVFCSKPVVSNVKNSPLPRFLKFALNEYLYKVFWFFTDNRIDIYLVIYFLGITQAGYFAFAINIVNMLTEWSPGAILRSVISPMFVRQFTNNNKVTELQYLFQLYNKFLIFLTMPIFFFVGILGKEIIHFVFGAKYVNSLFAIQIFLFFGLFCNLLIPIRNILALFERPDISNLSNIFALLKFLLILALIKPLGINGAAIAYGISLFSIIAFNLIMMKKFFKPQYPWLSIFKISLNTLIVGLMLFLIKNNIHGLIELVFAMLIGVCFYGILSYLNKPFNNYDREFLNRGFKIPIWHF